jgi:hypothetical protein
LQNFLIGEQPKVVAKSVSTAGTDTLNPSDLLAAKRTTNREPVRRSTFATGHTVRHLHPSSKGDG